MKNKRGERLVRSKIKPDLPEYEKGALEKLALAIEKWVIENGKKGQN